MDSTLACLAGWMAHQRWYSSKGSAPTLRLLARTLWESADDDAIVEVVVVADDSVTPSVAYQVPLVTRPHGHDVDPQHVVCVADDGRVVVDGPHDPAYAAALLSRIASRDEEAAAIAAGAEHRRSRVLSGEQSNTSIIFGTDAAHDSDPVICKVFRQLNPGLNPDIELQSALARAGSPHVPRSLGHLDALWTDPAHPDEHLSGSLAFAQEFLPDVEDAWRVARRAATQGESFASAAHALGAATADVHESLAQLFPTVPSEGDARTSIIAAWRRRLSIAASEVPGLAAHQASIAAVYERARGTVWPPLQRIHGDYHLGQVLQSPGRGWVLLDFEGEPMRPMAERRRPDSPLRDVAGMLRSFDYVAASLERDDADPALTEWASAARRAFLGGYEHRMGTPATGPLLDAFELDKAVYEAIYEARNRPSWLPIPLRAVSRLVLTTQTDTAPTQ